MKIILVTMNTYFSSVNTFFGWYLGNIDGFLYLLLIFMIADYITTVFCAITDHKLSKEIGMPILIRKIVILILVGIAHCLDVYLIKTGSALRIATIFFYISNEGNSLLRNAYHLGLPIPEKLKKILKLLQVKDNDNS